MVCKACLKLSTDDMFLIVAVMLSHAMIVAGMNEYLSASTLVLIWRILFAMEPRVLLLVTCSR